MYKLVCSAVKRLCEASPSSSLSAYRPLLSLTSTPVSLHDEPCSSSSRQFSSTSQHTQHERSSSPLSCSTSYSHQQQHRHSLTHTTSFPHQRWSSLHQLRGVFGASQAGSANNPQVHTHDKYKFETTQPTYDWMIGRFVMDRNGLVWHKQANRQSKRYGKAKGTLQRLKRWKAVQPAVAAKFRKLPGVSDRLKYWAPPDPLAVPGFSHDTPHRTPPRVKAKADRRVGLGDPALRQH